MFLCQAGRSMEFHTNLQNLYNELQNEARIDKIDWLIATKFAQKWKLSVADALVDLNFVEESTLARCLAAANHLVYIPGSELSYDFSEVSLEHFEDLMNVGAAPLEDSKLAICNPYDDHHGYLDSRYCAREMIVTERSAVIDALRRHRLFQEV